MAAGYTEHLDRAARAAGCALAGLDADLAIAAAPIVSRTRHGRREWALRALSAAMRRRP